MSNRSVDENIMIAAHSTLAKSLRRSERLTTAGQSEPTATGEASIRRGSAKKAALAVQVDGSRSGLEKSGHRSPSKPVAASISEVLLELDDPDTDEAVMRANAKLPVDTLLDHLNQLEVSPALPVRSMVRGPDDRPMRSGELFALAAGINSPDAAAPSERSDIESDDGYLLSRRQTADVSELHRLMTSSLASNEASDILSRRAEVSLQHGSPQQSAAVKVQCLTACTPVSYGHISQWSWTYMSLHPLIGVWRLLHSSLFVRARDARQQIGLLYETS